MDLPVLTEFVMPYPLWNYGDGTSEGRMNKRRKYEYQLNPKLDVYSYIMIMVLGEGRLLSVSSGVSAL